jgi:hypothetical protein
MRWIRSLLGGIVLVVITGGALFVWRWHERGPGRASVEDAIDRFRTSSTVSAPTSSHPPAGVYVYAGEGREHLSFLGTEQRQGPKEPGTVVVGADGCWTFTIEYNSYHRQSWDRCSVGDRLVERGGTTHQKFDFAAFTMSETSTVSCNPPMTLIDRKTEPGTSWPMRCQGTSDTTGTKVTHVGRNTFVGPETVRVDDRAVPALHVRQETRLAGDQSGDVVVDMWFAVADWLPLREQHDINVQSPAPPPLDNVTYSEAGSWQLTSLEPRT